MHDFYLYWVHESSNVKSVYKQRLECEAWNRKALGIWERKWRIQRRAPQYSEWAGKCGRLQVCSVTSSVCLEQAEGRIFWIVLSKLRETQTVKDTGLSGCWRKNDEFLLLLLLSDWTALARTVTPLTGVTASVFTKSPEIRYLLPFSPPILTEDMDG